MSIEKIRHGAEISSAKLNEIIEAINKTNNEHQNIRDLGESIKNTVKEVYNTLEKYSEQVGEHLESIPEIKNLYADILLSRDTVDWIDIAEDETDVIAFIANALNTTNNNPSQMAERLKIIRGTQSQINTIPRKDKQILIAYDQDANNGLMFLDCYDAVATKNYRENNPSDPTHEVIRRIPISSSGDVTITGEEPELSFETKANGEEVLKIQYKDKSFESQDLRGPAGPIGKEGAIGPKGEKGDKGDKGDQGIPGAKGQDGATTRLSIWFSDYSTGMNATENYNNHKYMGIKTYLSTDDYQTQLARPIKWFRISGDTLYPVYDKNTGYLTFTTDKPAESSFYIKGDTGPQGPTGEAPEINFRKSDGTLITLTSESTDGKFIYDASMFRGEQGEKGDVGPRGPEGEKGDTPVIKFKAQHTDEAFPSIEETTPLGSEDVVWTLNIPKGQDGLSIIDAKTLIDGSVEVYLSRTPNEENPTIDKTINLGVLKGDKGEKGESGTIEIKGAVNSIDDLPTTNIKTGYAYVVTSKKDEEDVSELYICVDINALTIDTMYKNLGNIKGEKGNPGDNGKDGSTWILGTEITKSGEFTLDAGYKINDYYLNINTGRIFKIVFVDNTSYRFVEVTDATKNLKGPQGEKGETGETGSAGRGISRIEQTSHTEMSDTYTIVYTDDTTHSFVVNHGTDGKDGSDGKDGAIIHSGTNIPSETLGKIGDLFIDTVEGHMFEKTGEREWREYDFVLKAKDGKDGKDGIRGPQINTLQGTTTLPSPNNFIIGDLILVLQTSNLYQLTGTEDNRSWSYIGNLNGFSIWQSSEETEESTTSIPISSLPANSVPKVGDTIIANSEHSYMYTITGINSSTLSVAFKNKLKGDKGDQGIQGEPGSYFKASLITVTAADISLELSQGKYHVFTNTAITNITLTLGQVAEGTVGEYTCEFTITTGNTVPTITLPDTVKYANGWTYEDFEPGYKYVIYIFNDIAYVTYVEV